MRFAFGVFLLTQVACTPSGSLVSTSPNNTLEPRIAEADRQALVALWSSGRGPRGVVLDAGGELSRKLSAPEREAIAPVIVLRGRA